MKYDMIMFDVDGTIWDVSNNLVNSINIILEKHNYTERVDVDKVKNGMGKNAHDFSNFIFDFIYDEDQRMKILKETETLKRKFIEDYGMKPYPNFVETIKDLSENYKVGIVSNCGEGTIEQLIRVLHIEEYISGFVAASKYGITKAEGIIKVAKENNAQNYIYVGDTILDKEASSLSNAKFVWAKYGFGKNIESDYSIEKVDDLFEVIKQIEKEN